MNTVLVLGANGRFGRAAVDAFAAAGWCVLAQVRRPPCAPLPSGVQLLDTALADTAALARQAQRAVIVVYAINPVYTRWEQDLLSLFHQGIAVARAIGAVLMLPGNVYNYGEHTMPALLTEQTPEHPSTRKGELRIAMEDELRTLAREGLQSVLIRAGDFFGCGTGSYLDLVIAKDIRRGRLVYPGPPELTHAWAYLPDLARAFVAVADATVQRARQPEFRRLHFAGHTLTGHEFISALQAAAASLHLKPAHGFRVGRMPWTLLRLLGIVHPMLRELSRMSYLWRVPHALAGESLERAVGALPCTPIERALRQSLIDLGHDRSAAPRSPAGEAPLSPAATP